MRFNVYKEAKISLIILTIILIISLLFYFFASMFTSMGYSAYCKVNNSLSNKEPIYLPTIILDAGHGGEDPGAVDNGLFEKDINLSLVNYINSFLSLNGYQAILTRDEDKLLYEDGQENKKKYHDIRNRLEIAQSYSDSIFVSIHMNKYPANYCKGLQTFYSENNDSSLNLAKSIQNNARILQMDNKREVVSGNDTIYLLANINTPAVMVECGFLSNPDEAKLLYNDEYLIALALTIYCGIAEYTECKNEKP